MTKAIGTLLKVGGIVALGILTAGSAFIVAIGTPGAFAFISSTLGTAFLVAGAAVSIGGSLTASAAAAPKFEDPGLRLTLTTDSAAAREICYGMAATGGNLIFRDTVGANNSDLWTVTVLAGHEIESLEEVKFGGVITTFSSNEAVGQFAGKWFQYVFLGTDSQAANSNLVAASTKWTTNHRLRGVAYVVNRFIYDQDVFPKGLEQVVYVIKGKKLYDPRLDTTQGGSGSHRFSDKSTWEWSENSVMCEIDYKRGEVQNSRLIWGMGQAETAFDWPNVISEANICEEQITLKAGGTEDRYTCNGFLNTSDRHETNIRAILSSCAGNVVWQSGKWRFYVGTARTATKTRLEEHFIGPVKYIPKKEYRARINAIRGLYNDPEAGYQAKDYPPVISSTFVTEDGGQELWGDLNLSMTKSKSTAQRLANIALKSARMEKVFSGTVNTIGFEDQAQDSVNLTYSRFNLSSQKMIISDWALRFQNDDNGKIGLVIEETFIETDDTIYSWTAADDETTVPIITALLNPPPVLFTWGDVDDDGNKPVDNATNNTGALADLDTVSPAEIDTDAVTEVKLLDGAVSLRTFNSTILDSSISEGDGPVTVISLTHVDTKAARVHAQASLIISANIDASITIFILTSIGGGASADIDLIAGKKTSVTLVSKLTPDGGVLGNTHTIELQVFTTSATVTIHNASLISTELRN